VATAIASEQTTEPDPTRESTVALEPHSPIVTSASTGNYDELLKAHFGNDWWIARAVMLAESGGRRDAIGDNHLTYFQGGIKYGYSVGLFQIRFLPGRPDPNLMLDPEYNIRHAADMWRAQGWRPWSAYTNGSYRRFL
jgi:hypothetical protein